MGIFLKMPHRPMLFLFIPFLLLFPFLFAYREHTLTKASELFCDGEEFYIYGTLYKKELKSDSVNLYLKNLYYQKESIPGRLVISYDSDNIPMYAKVHICATVKIFSSSENDGGFDEKTYYNSMGIVFRGENAKIIEFQENKRLFLGEKLYLLKKEMMRCYDTYLPGEEAGLLRAMCLGDKTFLDTQAKSLFRDAGLSHILAVSGLHVSIVGMALFRFLKRMGFGYFLSGIFSAFTVLFYGSMVGFTNSSLRAVFMFFVLMLSMILGEAYDMVSSWMAAFIIVLCMEPLSVLNSGFVFSFGAVLGIFMIANPLVKRYEALCEDRFKKTLRYRRGKNYRKSLKEKTVSAVLFSVGIQLFTLPIVSFYYYEIPIYVVGLNLVLIPLLSVLIGGGLLGGMGMVLFGRGKGILYVCHLILYFYEYTSDQSLQLPMARIVVGKPSVVKSLLYYAVLFLLVYWKKIYANVTIRKWVVRVLCMSLMLLFLLRFKGPGSTSISMLSVGQGDGICVISKEGVVYMVDGGSSSKKNIGKYTLKPFLSYHGISKVDCWLISHLDSDHISGLIELLEDGYPVDTVVLTESVKQLSEETAREHYETIEDLCEKTGAMIRYIQTGDSFGTKSLSFVCLSPEKGEYDGTNENSMVLKMTYGDFDMIFTGDIGTEQEMDILNKRAKALEDVEILKSAHHGSKYSNCEKWLTEISPKLTLFSAGKNNRYGHPSKETLERMNNCNLTYLSTIESGQVTLIPKTNGSFQVNTRYLSVGNSEK